MTWRVLTWNILGAQHPPLEQVAAHIRHCRPDVVALQEVRRRQAHRLARLLGWRVVWRAKHYPYGPLVWWTAEGLAVLAPTPLSEPTRRILSVGEPLWIHRRRIMVSATVTRADGATLRVHDLHLATGSADERTAQARRAALAARAEAHRMRDWSDAVLVGIGTALADDPGLDVRHVEGRDPVRVVLDTHLRLPPSSKLATHASAAPTWILHGPGADAARREALERPGVELVEVPATESRVDVTAALRELARRGIVRLLVEGGATVHGALLRGGLAQEAAVFVAPKILGDAGAIPLADAGPRDRVADAWRLVAPTVRVLGEDVLFRG